MIIIIHHHTHVDLVSRLYSDTLKQIIILLAWTTFTEAEQFKYTGSIKHILHTYIPVGSSGGD